MPRGSLIRMRKDENYMMLAQYNESRKFMWKSIVAIVALVSALAAFATGCAIANAIMRISTED